MRKIIPSMISVLLVILMSGVLLADTLYMKNGNVLKGTLLGYDNGYFLFQIDTGEDNPKPTRIAVTQVSRLVMDRGGAGYSDTRPVNPRPTAPERPRGYNSFPPFEVSLADQWVKSVVPVARGQRVRVEASGQITLDGRTQTSPDGLNRRDPDAPLPNENDGALIVAIGTDPNSPPILIGRSREFTADRDGDLYFTANHWNTTDARGAFQVRVSVDRGTGITGVGSNTGATSGASNPNLDWRERTLTITAGRQWTDTSIDVEPGMRIEITATGNINLGDGRRLDANGDRSQSGSAYLLVPNAGAGALIGRIRYRQGGESTIVVVGAQNSLTVEQNESGRLWLGINDDFVGDNSGAFSVKIRYAKQ